MLKLYTWATPNGRKVSVMLEELGLSYEVHSVNITKGEQLRSEFLALNANNKIPVLVDTDGEGGDRVVLAESGAILIYLAEKFGSALLPANGSRRASTLAYVSNGWCRTDLRAASSLQALRSERDLRAGALSGRDATAIRGVEYAARCIAVPQRRGVQHSGYRDLSLGRTSRAS
ncbi:Glutathione S-transferase, N-terminal domain [Burkholderia sp. OK233]|nr:Glutathione S-transferase, N-terminal domain [Burkholderia sp. OK233]